MKKYSLEELEMMRCAIRFTHEARYKENSSPAVKEVEDELRTALFASVPCNEFVERAETLSPIRYNTGSTENPNWQDGWTWEKYKKEHISNLHKLK